MGAIGAGRPRPRIFGATPSVGRPARIQSRFLLTYRTRRALQLCYYALSLVRRLLHAEKIRTSLQTLQNSNCENGNDYSSETATDTAKFYNRKVVRHQILHRLGYVRFLYSAGKAHKSQFGLYGLQGRSPCTEARRASTPLLLKCAPGDAYNPQEVSAPRGLIQSPDKWRLVLTPNNETVSVSLLFFAKPSTSYRRAVFASALGSSALRFINVLGAKFRARRARHFRLWRPGVVARAEKSRKICSRAKRLG